MDKLPVAPKKRRRYEGLIRALDIFVYLVVFLGGIYALVATSNVVVDELAGAGWLIGIWSALLLAGGLIGFLGRLTRYWLVEMPATVSAFFGVVIYFIILGKYTFTSITAATAATLVLVAGAFMLRRWFELQIFGSDPARDDWRFRLAEAARRRTQDIVPRTS